MFDCLSIITSGLVEIKPQFTESDVKIFPQLLFLFVPGVTVLVEVTVSHLCTTSPVYKLTCLRGCVQSMSAVQLTSLLSLIKLSPVVLGDSPHELRL